MYVMFELKKLVRQKKFLWLLFIVFLYITTIYIYNYQQYPEMRERAYSDVQSLEDETRVIQAQLTQEKVDKPENTLVAEQLTVIQSMLSALFQWKMAVSEENWEHVAKPEVEFLSYLQTFIDSGGEFSGIPRVELQSRIQKSNWLQKYDLPYEDEEYPLSPQLIMKESSLVFFGIIGLVLMVLLFGNTISQEKEQNTWSTLATQPIPRWQLVAGKYVSLLLAVVLFVLIVIGVSILIPLLFQKHPLSIHYPVIAGIGESAVLIPMYQFISRAILFFISANAFLFSLIFLFSSWTKNSFLSVMLTVFSSLSGYILTGIFSVLQGPYNPFHSLMVNRLIMTAPSKTDLLYLIWALAWSFILLLVAGRFLKREEKKLFSFLHQPFNKGRTQLFSRSLPNFILFEWRKEWRKGLLLQVMSVLSVFVVLGSVILTFEKNEKAEKYISGLKEESRVIEEVIIPYYEEAASSIENNQGDKGYADRLEQILQISQERLGKLNKAVVGYYQNELSPLQEYHLFELQAANGNFDNTGFLQSQVLQLGQFTIDVSLAEKKWMMEKQVDLMIAGPFNPTIYTTWTHQQSHETNEQWMERNQKVGNSGLYSLYYYFTHYFSYIIIVFFFLLGGGFAKERGKRPTIQFIRTQSLSVKQVFLGKLIASSCLSFFSWTILVFFVVLVGMIANGIGDWQYPIVHYDSAAVVNTPSYNGQSPIGWNTGFHLETLGSVVLENYTLFSLMLVFLIILSVFLSIFIKNQFSVFAVAVIISISGYAASTKIFSSIAHLLPFTYLNPVKVINGEMSVNLNNPDITFASGCLVIIGTFLFFGMVGYFVLHSGKEGKRKLNLKGADKTIGQ